MQHCTIKSGMFPLKVVPELGEIHTLPLTPTVSSISAAPIEIAIFQPEDLNEDFIREEGRGISTVYTIACRHTSVYMHKLDIDS